MSAPAESSTPPVAAVAPGPDDSRLDQPADAVAMDSVTQPAAPASEEPSSVNPAAAAGTRQALGPSTDEPAATDKDDDVKPEPPRKERSDSIAIGPAQDDIKSASQAGDDAGPVCNITLLLTSGSRHPYKINARYLTRRNVPIPEETDEGLPDPFSISVYTLKELILREWRADWEAKPASPSSIRLIHFGKLLDDKEALKNYQFLATSPNVVHMSIRPQDLDEEEPKTGAKAASQGGADGQRRRSGGCCVVL